MLNKFIVMLFCMPLSFAQVASQAQAGRPTVYIEPQQGFETYIAAALTKKNVPVDVVTDASSATYILKSAPVEIQKESTGGKIARCAFLSCAGIEDKGTVSVQLVEVGSGKELWAYSVNKQKGGKNEQAMAEAIAKHFKEFLSKAPTQTSTVAQGQTQIDTVGQAAHLVDVSTNSDSAVPVQLASITVKSTPPGADIVVDGKFVGSTPSTIQLPVGDHLFSVEKEGLTPWQRTMNVTAGGDIAIDATLNKP